MNYQTYKPHKDLETIVKFYWTMEVPFNPKNQKQKMNSDLFSTQVWSGFSFLFIHSKSWSLFRSVIFDAISHNGLALGAVADFGAQNCQYTTKVDAR